MAKLPIAFETTFETYTSERVIGDGGAGRVFEVVSGDGGTYALKLLEGADRNSDRARRFKNELTFCMRKANPRSRSM